jgi:cell division protein FtsL
MTDLEDRLRAENMELHTQLGRLQTKLDELEQMVADLERVIRVREAASL